MRRIAVLAATAALVLAACGGDDDEPAAPSGASGGGGGESSGASTLRIAADPGGAKKFTESNLTASAGKVTVEFANESQLPHAVEIEGNGIEEETETVTGEDAPPLTVDLKPGTYTIYCPVGDHRAEGMEGTLTVQ
jgi:plastocyanin